MTTLKVLHVITGLATGGAEQQLRDLVRHTRHETEVAVLTNPGVLAREIAATGVPVHDLRMRSNTDLAAVPRLAGLIRRGRYQVVHTHLYRSMLYGRLAARLAGVRVSVATEHSLTATTIEGRPTDRRGVREMYLAAERLGQLTVAVSPTVSRQLVNWGVPESRIRTIPNGIDPGAFRFDATARRRMRARLGIAPDARVIGSVGRLAPARQVELLIDVARDLPDAVLLLVGDGTSLPTLRDRAARHGIADRVVFAGESRDLRAMYSAMDVYASTAPFETFGIAMLEAQAAGLPAVYLTCPAIDDLPPGRFPAAHRVPPDRAVMRRSLRTLLDAEHERTARVAPEYDMTLIAGQIDDVYESVGTPVRSLTRSDSARRDVRVPAAPHVLHVAQPTDGGVRRYLLDVCADQLGRGWRVSLASPEGPLAEDARALGVGWRRWDATRAPGPATLREAWTLRRLLRAVEPSVVHLHSAKAGLAGRLVIAGRRPTIFQPHGWSWLATDGPTRTVTRAWEQWAGRLADVVVCVGDGEAAAGRAAGVTAPLRVVRNGVDLTRFAPADDEEARRARELLGLPAHGAVVLCPGRLTRQKGQDVVLAAWPAVRARHPEATLVIVGDGEDADRLRAGAPTGVRFVPATELRPWYTAADLVTLPSRWEGLPLVALEAGASGLPVVGSAIPGLTELITPDTGTLVPPDRSDALADALAALLADAPLTRRLGAAARARVVAGFDQRRTHGELAALTLAVAGITEALPAAPAPTPRRPASPVRSRR